MSYELRVKKIIQVPVAETYAAFTDKDKLSWFSEGSEINLQKGGRFSNADGDSGEYLDIVPHRLLTFTWETSQEVSRVEVQFKVLSEVSTEVSLRQYLLNQEADAEKMKTCWSWALASLASFLETGRPLTMSEWKKANLIG